jgi:hypothetical protein
MPKESGSMIAERTKPVKALKPERATSTPFALTTNCREDKACEGTETLVVQALLCSPSYCREDKACEGTETLNPAHKLLSELFCQLQRGQSLWRHWNQLTNGQETNQADTAIAERTKPVKALKRAGKTAQVQLHPTGHIAERTKPVKALKLFLELHHQINGIVKAALIAERTKPVKALKPVSLSYRPWQCCGDVLQRGQSLWRHWNLRVLPERSKRIVSCRGYIAERTKPVKALKPTRSSTPTPPQIPQENIAERTKPVKALKRPGQNPPPSVNSPDCREDKACEGTETRALQPEVLCDPHPQIAERTKPVKRVGPVRTDPAG